MYNYALCVTATVIEDPDEMSARMPVGYEASYWRGNQLPHINNTSFQYRTLR